jgi:hypothetical protein
MITVIAKNILKLIGVVIIEMLINKNVRFIIKWMMINVHLYLDTNIVE